VISVPLRREVARFALPHTARSRSPHGPSSYVDTAWGRTGAAVLGLWPYDAGASVFLFDATPLARWLAGGRRPKPRELELPWTDAAGYPASDTTTLAVSPAERWMCLSAAACERSGGERLASGVLFVDPMTGARTSVAIPGTTCCSSASFASDDELDAVCQMATGERPRWCVVRRQGNTWSLATSRQLGVGPAPEAAERPANLIRNRHDRLWLSWLVRGSGSAQSTGILEVVDAVRGSLRLAVRAEITGVSLRGSSRAWLALADGSVQEIQVFPGPVARLAVTREIAPPPPAREPPLSARTAISRSGRIFVTGEAGGNGKGATLWLWEFPPARKTK
jgi:hypothetical protein